MTAVWDEFPVNGYMEVNIYVCMYVWEVNIYVCMYVCAFTPPFMPPMHVKGQLHLFEL